MQLLDGLEMNLAFKKALDSDRPVPTGDDGDGDVGTSYSRRERLGTYVAHLLYQKDINH